MRQPLFVVGLAIALASIGACNNNGGGSDAGPAMDAFMRPDTGPCATNDECPGSYCNAGNHHCCEPADPPYEICGDRIDQNCDMHDESCGDNDHDGVQACMAGQDPLGGCDCDDENAMVRPPVGSVAGADEACDHLDNDCDGRIDEAAACCPACQALGADGSTRADTCTATGECDCASEPGVGPCATGMTCCSAGCTDTQTDRMNCDFCGAACTAQADSCVAGACQCGDGPPCNFTGVCTAGACPMM